MIKYQILANQNYFKVGRIRHFETTSRLKNILYQTVFILILFTVAIFGYVAYIKEYMVLSVILLITYIVVLFAKPISMFVYMRAMKKHSFYKKYLKFVFSNDGILMLSEKKQVDIKWDNITKFIRCDDGFLLYQGKELYDWLPDEYLDENSSLDSMKILVEKNV